jgi:aspartyl-tRNA(Asn)/glutamyl-tRNA(Gln) amidotransferase subunit A
LGPVGQSPSPHFFGVDRREGFLVRYDGAHFGHRTKDHVKDIFELYSKSRAEGFGEELQRRIIILTCLSTSR